MDPEQPIRVAAHVGGLTLACDVACAFPAGKVLRTVLIAVRVGRLAGLSDDQLAHVYYANLLRFLGCTGFSHEEGARYGAGDDIAVRNVMAAADAADPVGVVRSVVLGVGAHADLASRAVAVARLLGDGEAVRAHAAAQCDVSIRMAELVGMPPPVLAALAAICERWDGKGVPRGLLHEQIDVAMRLHHLADGAEIAWHRAGHEAAVALVRRRRGGWVDPALADLFVRNAGEVLADLDGPDLFQRFLDAEPAPHHTCPAERADDIATAFANLADLKCAHTVGHSMRVAALAEAAAREAGVPRVEVVRLRRAALLHDVGRLAIPNTVWDRPARLGFADMERVRLHAYYSERVLSQSSAWRGLASLAAHAHEQPDGQGYHRALSAAATPVSARLLRAADAIAAMGEARPHRPALSRSALEREVREEVRANRMDKVSADAVLAALGLGRRQRATPRRALSDREVEVLRHVARGKTNREIGTLLGVSPRTVQVHVAHLYDKLGVESRAGAALFAATSGLLEPDDA